MSERTFPKRVYAASGRSPMAKFLGPAFACRGQVGLGSGHFTCPRSELRRRLGTNLSLISGAFCNRCAATKAVALTIAYGTSLPHVFAGWARRRVEGIMEELSSVFAT